jgi:CHAT domain-containing protein
VLGGRYPNLVPQLEQLTLMRRRIARRTLEGPGELAVDAHQELLARWNAEREALEGELGRQIPEMRLEERLRAVNRHSVAAEMPEHSVLLEFFRTPIFDFQAVAARGESSWKPARYLVFLLRAGHPDSAEMLDLGEAAHLDGLIAEFLSAIAENPQGAVYLDPGQRLRQAIFDPIAKKLGSNTRLLVSPDGDLNLLPLEVLPTHAGAFLTDTYRISYVSSGRDLVRYVDEPVWSAERPVIAANPAFRWPEDEKVAEEQAQEQMGKDGFPGRSSREFREARLVFKPLPGAQEEGRRVALCFADPITWTGTALLESRVKAIRSPPILHLATHGFFLPDQQLNPKEGSPWAILGEANQLRGPGMENPMLRSGLALAGAQTWLEKGKLPAEAEDGLLTAEDVTGMDLLGTELVVLSACDTGRGEVRAGEGVFGLRRAFEIAGARTIVMSMWKANDGATRDLMVSFYDELAKGSTKLDALRHACTIVRKKYVHPAYWGAFILQGHPGEMRRRGPLIFRHRTDMTTGSEPDRAS